MQWYSPRSVRHVWVGAAILLCALARASGMADAQSPSQPPAQPQVSEELLARVPEDLREAARKTVMSERLQRDLLGLSAPGEFRLAILLRVADRAGAEDLILDKLPTEPPRTRMYLVQAMRGARWAAHARTRPTLHRLLTDDTDPDTIRATLDALWSLSRTADTDTLRVLRERVAREHKDGPTPLFETVGHLEHRWQTLTRGTMLPTFLQKPPALFTVPTKRRTVRVVAFGDFGTGTPEQRDVAQAIQRLHRRRPFTLGVTLGDNFYPRGMESTTDVRWTTYWEEQYGRLGVPFYATLGNHDWMLPDSPAAELMYAARSRTWRMPATYYTFVAGPVQFFATDTTAMSATQQIWLRDALDRSRARWKVVYGHHPAYREVPEGFDVPESFKVGKKGLMQADMFRLVPILTGRADVYLAGHEHSMQHFKPEENTHHVIAGGGGRTLYPVQNTGASAVLFAKSTLGFAVLDATDDRLTITFVGTDGQPMYEHVLTHP